MRELYDLKVWEDSRQLVIKIYQITSKFPKQEMYGLIDQLRRAVNSICANIAEGYGRHHPKEKIKFYYIARGSIYECKSHIMIAKGLGYLSSDSSGQLLQGFDSVCKMLNAMIASLSRYSDSLTHKS